MNTNLVAWTGHRPELFRDPSQAQRTVEHLADELAAKRFLVGGQRGVDTWAALAAYRRRLPFTLVLPLPIDDFAADWDPRDRTILEQTAAWAAELRVIGGPAEAAYTERNRVLGTSADLLVAVWTGRTGGGTAETVSLAHAHGTPVREVRLAGSGRVVSGRGL